MLNGKVKWFDTTKGYGFIVNDEGKEVFVHYSQILAVVGGQRVLYENELVDYEVVDGRKGPQAANVRRLNPPANPKRSTYNKQNSNEYDGNYEDGNRDAEDVEFDSKNNKDSEHDNEDNFDYNAGNETKGNR